MENDEWFQEFKNKRENKVPAFKVDVDRLIKMVDELREEKKEQKFLFQQKTDQWKRLDDTCHDLYSKWGECQDEILKLKSQLNNAKEDYEGVRALAERLNDEANNLTEKNKKLKTQYTTLEMELAEAHKTIDGMVREEGQ